MNEIINVFKNVEIKPIAIGLLFVVIAVVVGVFKQYWLIAGVNTSSKKELTKIDLDYVGKYFGIFFGVFGSIIILSTFICSYFNIMNYFHRFFGIAIIVFCAFLFLYGHIKKNRIYKKNDSAN